VQEALGEAAHVRAVSHVGFEAGGGGPVHARHHVVAHYVETVLGFQQAAAATHHRARHALELLHDGHPVGRETKRSEVLELPALSVEIALVHKKIVHRYGLGQVLRVAL